jgi:hypothetical protein
LPISVLSSAAEPLADNVTIAALPLTNASAPPPLRSSVVFWPMVMPVASAAVIVAVALPARVPFPVMVVRTALATEMTGGVLLCPRPCRSRFRRR